VARVLEVGFLPHCPKRPPAGRGVTPMNTRAIAIAALVVAVIVLLILLL
jgi:hypothetical protein